MKNNQIAMFKNMLRSYKYYQERVDLLGKEIDRLQYLIDGVKGVGYDKLRYASEREFKYDLAVRRDGLIRERDIFIYTLKYVDDILAKCTEKTRSALIEIYVKNRTYDYVSDRHNYSKHGLFNKIHSELKKIE